MSNTVPSLAKSVGDLNRYLWQHHPELMANTQLGALMMEVWKAGLTTESQHRREKLRIEDKSLLAHAKLAVAEKALTEVSPN